MAEESGFVFEYDAPDEADDRLPFRIMDETFEARPMPGWVYIRYITAVAVLNKASRGRSTEGEMLNAASRLESIYNVFKRVLDEDDFDRFEDVMSRRGAPEIDVLIDLIEALTEKTAARPTKPSQASSAGPARTAPTSTADSSERIEVPAASVSAT